MIDVTQTADADPLAFRVVVRDAKGESRHDVTMTRATLARLAGEERTPTQCVEAAFRFLLDREPKEAILSRFDVDVISRYFPEFERALPDYF